MGYVAIATLLALATTTSTDAGYGWYYALVVVTFPVSIPANSLVYLVGMAMGGDGGAGLTAIVVGIWVALTAAQAFAFVAIHTAFRRPTNR